MKKIFVIGAAALFLTACGSTTANAGFSDCSSGWEVTGYYVPYEADFNGVKTTVSLDEGGTVTARQDFIDTVHTEGSGKLDDGRILEWYEDAWHINETPQDYFGNPLTLNTVAVDPEVIGFYTRLMIPTLQPPYNQMIFTASDIGPSIKGKHIDMFMGYGEHALDEAWKFPDYNQVCLETDADTAQPAASRNNPESGTNADIGTNAIPIPSTGVSAADIDPNLAKKLTGLILLQVEDNGEAWYLNPGDLKRYYLGRPADAFAVMRQFGLGATHDFISSHTVYPASVAGKILIDVDRNGEAYYINPADMKGYYLGRPADAFAIMRNLSLGISNGNLAKIEQGVL